MKKDIREIVARIDTLKPIPQVANKVMVVSENPQSSMSMLSEIIQYDQALTANLLKAANSAYFGLSRKVDSLHQAIVYLGMDKVVDLVVLGASSENYSQAQEGYDLAGGELWRSSVSSALIARDLAEKTEIDDTHAVFTAALVKDIGKVVLSQYVAESFEKINLLVSKHGFSFREAEKGVLGIDHAELGGMIAERWRFSGKMIDIIQHHHLPMEARFETEAAVVYLADTLCMTMGIGVGSDGLAYRFQKNVLEKMGFSDRDFQEVIAGFGEQISHVEDLINAT
ncbi:MAG: HDOD domain-containing protein [Deltaproteobacteria bacterium]|nr:HDOD domain-containing protein [Deltaproteobacteria bacterium]